MRDKEAEEAGDRVQVLLVLKSDGGLLKSIAVTRSEFSVGGNVEDECDHVVPCLGNATLFFQEEAGRMTVIRRGSGLGFLSKSLRPGKIVDMAGHCWLLISLPKATAAAACVGAGETGQPQPVAADGEGSQRLTPLLLRLVHWASLPMQGREMLAGALQGFLNILVQGTAAAAGALITFDQHGPRLVAASGMRPDQAESYARNFPVNVLQKIIQEDARLILPDELREGKGRDFRSTTLFLKGVNSVAGVPVIAEGQVQAILLINLTNILADLTEEMQSLLETGGRLLGLVFQRAVLREQLNQFKLRSDGSGKPGNRLMIGCSLAIDDVYQKLQKYAQVPIPVLITGETGTGKELAAREIHRQSPRAGGPFIAFNGAALPENLVEAELFGYKKGSFTGAISDRPGLIELAGGGTLFIDEIGEMPLGLQAKLLRAIQERQVTRLGESKPRSIDFRLVSATHCNLANAIAAGIFRQDLYYRIAGAVIMLPPLRQRPEDIPLLAQYFKSRYAATHQLAYKDFSREAVDRLTRHDWRGNVRELQHAVETSLIMADGDVITVADIVLDGEPGREHADDGLPIPGQAVKGIDGGPPHGRTLAEAKAQWLRNHLMQTLEAHAWNKSRTARSLGIGQRTLFRYIEQLAINDIPVEAGEVPNHAPFN